MAPVYEPSGYANERLEARDLTLIGSLVTGNAATGTDLERLNVSPGPTPSL